MNVATGHHYLPLAAPYHRSTSQPGQGQGHAQRVHAPVTFLHQADRHQSQLHQLICNQSNRSLSPSVTPPSPNITRGHVYSCRPHPATGFMLQGHQNNSNVHRAFLTPTSVAKLGSLLETSSVTACHRVQGRQFNKWLVHSIKWLFQAYIFYWQGSTRKGISLFCNKNNLLATETRDEHCKPLISIYNRIERFMNPTLSIHHTY